MKNPVRFIALLLALLLSATACGGADAPAADTTIPEDTTTAEQISSEYKKPDVDYGGRTVRAASYDWRGDFWRVADYNLFLSEENGDILNDAAVKAKRRVEEELNVKLEMFELGAANKPDEIITAVMAGDDEFKFALQMQIGLPKLLSDPSLLVDLNAVPTLDLSHSWWDQNAVEAYSLYGKQYAAVGDICYYSKTSLISYFFNKKMIVDNNLENPYDLVREGKWTLEKMRTYTKAVANLNGDDVYGKDSDGNAVYGFVSFANVIPKFIYAAGAEYVNKDKNGELVINCSSQRFIETCQTLAEFFGTKGEVLMASSDSTLNTYYQLYFEKQKCLFFGGELKTASLLRNMEQSFGILPIPKIDESQSSYYVTSVHQCPAFVIPVTNNAPEEIGLIFDALSYESEATVLEPYFSEYVEQKGLRNEDSIEMLDIIKSSRSYDIGVVYGWITTLETALKTAIQNGNTDISSTVAANEASITESLNKMLEAFKD